MNAYIFKDKRWSYQRDIIFGVLLIFISAIFTVWISYKTGMSKYELARLSNIKEELIKENSRLIVELSVLRSPSRIRSIAEKEFGLVIPSDDQLICVEE